MSVRISDPVTDPEAAVAAPSLEDSSTLLEKALMLYMNKFFTVTAIRPLEFSDLGTISKQDASATVFSIALEEWHRQMGSKPPGKRSLVKPLFEILGSYRFLLLVFLNAATKGINYIPVLVLGELVNYVSGVNDLSTAMLWIMVVSLLVVPVIGVLLSVQYLILHSHLGVQFKVALINLIYEKSLKMSTAAKSQEDGASTGQVVTMFSNDTMMVQGILFALSDLLILPFTIAIGIYLVYREVGVAVFVGLALFVVAIPPTMVIFVLLSMFRMQKLVFTDERIKLTNELLTGIRIVKLSSWEKAFSAVIHHIRVNELKSMRKSGYSLAFGIALILNAVPIFLPILVFFTYVRLGNNLTTAKAFVTISLFALIKWPLVQLPGALSHLNLSMVSMNRIRRYLESDELESYVGSEFTEDANAPGDEAKETKAPISVQLIDATLGWIPSSAAATTKAPDVPSSEAGPPQLSSVEEDRNVTKYAALPSGESESGKDSTGLSNRSLCTLLNVNLTIRSGSLVAVVGPVGSGKSSLLCALLGELHRHKGKVSMTGTVAYCDQRSWINNDTVEGNILLGLPYNEEKLNHAIYAACLDDDIKVLSGGLKTQIGEKGVNLSGGQKARVSFARAVYADSDLYLLDDPLSAVDAHVGQFLFRETICNILKSKTRIMVTHQVQYLPYCDQIIALRDGAVAFCGNYDDFVKSSEFVPTTITKEAERSESDDAVAPEAQNRIRLDSAWGETRDAALTSANRSADERKNDQRSSIITTVEERDEGFIDNSVYYAYAKAGGLGIAAMVAILMLISQVVGIGGSFWLSMWGSQGTVASTEGNTLISQDFSNEPQIFFLNVLAIIYCIGLIFTVAAIVTQVSHRMGASYNLYMNVLQSILNAPMSFFDSTPLGRILNRFSSDTAIIDEMVADNTYLTMDSLLSVFSAMLAIAIATTGTFLVLLVPLVLCFYRIARYYRLANTALSRLESVSRSPVFADFSQMLSGLISIRAYRKQTTLFNKMQSSVDTLTLATITVNGVSMWLMIRLDFLTSLISFFVAVIAVTASGILSPQYLGLALTYSFQLNETTKTLIRMVGMMDTGMNGVERISHYTHNIPQEKQTVKDLPEEGKLPENWPSGGLIVAEDAEMRYRNGPLVLKGLSFTIQPGEKVGIVGRTGSGKSSMMNAVFRVEELVSGRITIDGVDIAAVPLTTLRTSLGIIPQESVMFSETVRFNLDPFNEFSDEDILGVLESINMKNAILNLPNKLEEKVAEGGDNFSAGQRQLLCIARAILRKPKILILDEATASVDNDADNLVQNVIRGNAFKNSTVLTIAHRLHTIIDCDKIMVLSDGKLCEMDTPAALLAKPDSLFAQLWANANKEQSRS